MSASPKKRVISIGSISELPENYESLSVYKESEFYVEKENREAISCINVNFIDSDETLLYIVVNMESRNKMIYKKYVKIAEQKEDTDYRIVRCSDPNVLSAIYSTFQDDTNDEETFDSEVIDQVKDLIHTAIVGGVSDVHIEIREKISKIRFRTNGYLKLFKQLSYFEGEKIGIVLYQALATESGVVFNASVPQDAMVDETFNGIRARLRIATAPASPNGFDMVIRILRFSEKSSYTILTDLGYSEEQSNAIYSFSSDPVGVTIIAGTTGSGKSTTLKNILTKKIMDHNATLKVITVEDPPEYEIPNATQIPVIRDDKGSAEAGFSGAIRTAMRSDPDVLMIGEVRDNQSASLLVSATQSGHQVLSTLHAPSAVGIIPRLESLGINRDVLSASDFISGLIYQKLLPKLCQFCAIPHKNMDGSINAVISEEDVITSMNLCSKDDISRVRDIDKQTPLARRLQDIGILSESQVIAISKEYNLKLIAFEKTGFAKRLSKALKGRLMGVMHKGSGCPECGNSGISGRLVVAEILIPNDAILMAIRSGDDLATLKAWRESRLGQSILLSSLDKIAEGIVDPMHVEAEIGVLDG